MSRGLCRTISTYTEVDVDIDLLEEVAGLDESDKAKLMSAMVGVQGVPFGLGDGDAARIRSVVERAYLAAKAMPSVPREIADLFWIVHERAL